MSQESLVSQLPRFQLHPQPPESQDVLGNEVAARWLPAANLLGCCCFRCLAGQPAAHGCSVLVLRS